jgi:hypothetical protein
MAHITRTKEGDCTFSAGKPTDIRLNRDHHVVKYVCCLTVNHDNAVGATFLDDHFFKLINFIDIVGDSREHFKNVMPQKFHTNALLNSGRAMNHTVVTTADTAGNTSKIWFTIDIAKPSMVRPLDYVINTAVFDSLVMNVKWSNADAVGTGITINSASLDVWSEKLIGYSRNPGETTKYFIEEQKETEVTSTTSNFQITLPADQLYLGFTLVAEDGGNRSDDIINKITLKSGTTVLDEIEGDALQAYVAESRRVQTPSDLKGIYRLDRLVRGRRSDLMNTARNGKLNNPQIILDVTKGAGTTIIRTFEEVEVITDHVEVKAAAAAK